MAALRPGFSRSLPRFDGPWLASKFWTWWSFGLKEKGSSNVLWFGLVFFPSQFLRLKVKKKKHFRMSQSYSQR